MFGWQGQKYGWKMLFFFYFHETVGFLWIYPVDNYVDSVDNFREKPRFLGELAGFLWKTGRIRGETCG
mgnify:CR=1 FL=1